MTAYCLRCKTQRDISDPQPVTMKNGRKVHQGSCVVCGAKITNMAKVD